jgi:hypothetical protein
MLAEQIVNNIGAPDIIALEEIMGDGSAKDGSDIYKTLNTLIQNIKTVSNGMVQYSNISIPDNNSDRNIAILYRIDGNLSFKRVVSRNCCNFVAALYTTIITPRPSIDTFCP